MGSQLISNAVRSFFLAMVLTGLLTGSVAEAASYQKTNGTIVDPILDNFSNTHAYSGPNLKPGAYLPYANLTNAFLYSANLTGANLYGADVHNAKLINADLAGADLTGAILNGADLHNTDLTDANLRYAFLYGEDLSCANLTVAILHSADLTGADLHNAILPGANLYGANLIGADLYNVDLTGAWGVETSYGNPYYFGNTLLPLGFDPVAQGWTLSPYCDFTPGASCGLADINKMFQAGNLVTGVTTSGPPADWTWLITTSLTKQTSRSGSCRQLPQTATVRPTGAATPNWTATWTSLTSMCWPVTSIPRGMKIHTTGRFGMKAILMVMATPTLPISIFWPPILPHPAMPRRPYPNHPRCFWRQSP